MFNEEDIILQMYSRTPAPCRDYCGLTVLKNEIILNIWHVSFGPHVYPKRYKCPMEDFCHDKLLQIEIDRIFGKNIVAYVMDIARNKINLQNLPSRIFLNIIEQLAARDIKNLSETSKILFNVIYNFVKRLHRTFNKKYFGKTPDKFDKIDAEKCGWKEAVRQKINKHSISNSHKLEEKRQNAVKNSSSNKKSTTKSSAAVKKTIKVGNASKANENADNIKIIPILPYMTKPKVSEKNINKNVSKTSLSFQNKNKLLSTRSFSNFESKKEIRDDLKICQVVSTININKFSESSIRKTVSPIKSDIKFNNAHASAKHMTLKLKVPHELQLLVNQRKSSGINVKIDNKKNNIK